VKLKKYSILTQANKNLTLNDRKIFNYLLYLKQTQNSVNNKLYTTLKEINDFLKTKYNNKNILETFTKLSKIEMITNILNKDKNIPQNQSITPLKSYSYNIDNDFIIEFEFDPIINLLNGKNNLYSNLDINIIRTFKSKYSLILYEFINDYSKVSIPTLTIDFFKKILFANYDNFSILKKKVIEPALKEINQKTTFILRYTIKKLGKKVKFINFTFTNIIRDKTFIQFKKYMLKNHNNYIIQSKAVGDTIISSKLELYKWKIIYLNKDKLNFIDIKELNYFIEQNIKYKKNDNITITKKR